MRLPTLRFLVEKPARLLSDTLGEILGDFRFAQRSWRRRPAMATIVLLTVALATGAATALYDLANLIVWMPIPGTNADRLVQVYTRHPQPFIGPWGMLSAEEYLEYAGDRQTLQSLAAERQEELEARAIDGSALAGSQNEAAESTVAFPDARVRTLFVTGNYFETLGLRTARGRPLLPADDTAGAEGVVVLTHEFWRSHLGASPDLIGRSILLDDQEFRIVGVTDDRFRAVVAGTTIEALVAMTQGPALRPDFDAAPTLPRLGVYARLAPGATLQQSQAELQTLANELDRLRPNPLVKREITVAPARVAHPIDRKNFRPILQMLAAAVGLLLLLACANVANLLLSRGLERDRELSMRLALGAGRGRIVRQLLNESVLLAAAAGVLGVAVAVAARRLFVLWDLESFAAEMQIDHRVLAASLLTCLAVALLFGVLPALLAARSRPASITTARGSTLARGPLRVFASLASIQIALSMVLLVSTAAIAFDLWRLRSADLGFDDRGLVRAGFFLGDYGYDGPRSRQLMNDLKQQLETLPNVEAVSQALFTPPVFLDVQRQFRLPEEPDVEHSARVNFIDGDYFRTLGIALHHGRTFDDRELEGPSTVILNERLARRLWPDREPAAALGDTLILEQRRPTDPEPEHQIVGIVQTIKQHDLRSSGEPILYLPLQQRSRTSTALVARVRGDSAEYAAQLRSAVRALDPRVQPVNVYDSEQLRWDALVVERLQSQTVGLLAIVGLLLSLLGIFGVMQLTLARRRREIGIRMAVGANGPRITGWVLQQAARLAAIGVVVGFALSFWALDLLEAWVEGLRPAPWWLLVATGSALLITAIACCIAPARRAARVQPARELRGDT